MRNRRIEMQTRTTTTVGDIVFSCGPTVLIPGTCPTDVNRDGDTGINDFLALLGGWGACR